MKYPGEILQNSCRDQQGSKLPLRTKTLLQFRRTAEHYQFCQKHAYKKHYIEQFRAGS